MVMEPYVSRTATIWNLRPPRPPEPCIIALPTMMPTRIESSANSAPVVSRTTPYNALPVGIGPFKFERWDRAEQVVMVANPLYFRGRPKLDKVVLKLIPDRNTMLSRRSLNRCPPHSFR